MSKQFRNWSLRMFLAIAVLFTASYVYSQDTPKNTAANLTKTSVASKDTTIAGKQYVIYTGPRGGRYVIRTAASGNVYKQYLKKN